MLNVYQPQRQHVYQATILHTIFYFFIIAGAHIFNANYTNALWSDIGVMEKLRTSAGQFPYTIVMLIVGVVAIFLVSAATYSVMNKLHHRAANKNSPQTK